MDMDHLAPGLGSIVAGAMRRLALACAGPGETPAQAVCRICRVSPATVSRWLSHDRPGDLPPLAAVAALEMACGRPEVSTALMALSGDPVPPVPTHAATLSAGLAVCRSAGETVANISASIADGEVTPAEAREGLAAAQELSAHLARLSRKLGVIAEGGAP